MKNLRKINRSELKKIEGAGFSWNGIDPPVRWVECEKGSDSIALCPQQVAVKCIQLEPNEAIGCGPGQNCINNTCTGGLLIIK